MSTTMRAGVLGNCVPLPQCMLGIDNVHLLGYPLPGKPGGMTGRPLLWFSYGRHGRATSLAVGGHDLCHIIKVSIMAE